MKERTFICFADSACASLIDHLVSYETNGDPRSFSGTFTQANNSTGNYVVFTIGNVNAFTISATPLSASDGTLRAPLNGIQVVAQ